MSAHLTAAELTDLAEGLRGEASAPHLRTCGACRRQLGDLRAAISLASEVDVPEPSPLFWDHLSARISQRIASSPPRGRWWPADRWTPRIAVPTAIAGAVAVLLAFFAGAMLFGPHHLTRDVSTVATVPHPDTPDAPPSDFTADPSLAVVAGMMADADAQEADAALSLRPGALDGAVASLSDQERAVLARLVTEDTGANR